MERLIKDMRYCYICGRPYPEVHHIIFGNARRKKSDKYNLVIPLCYEHHRGKNGPHMNRDVDLSYKRMAQKHFEKHIGTREFFMKEFGKNYL